MNKKPFEPRLLELLDGDTSALDFCINIAFISEVFDDLYDKDKPVSDEQLQDALLTVLTLPHNKFYRANLDYLQPAIDLATSHWIASNQKRANVEKAHFFRYLGVQIWVAAVTLKIGIHAATLAINEIWEMTTMEAMQDFKNEMSAK